jgi:hypothetical protein
LQNCMASLLEGIRAREWVAACRRRRRWRGEDSRPGEEQGRRRPRRRATVEVRRRPRRGVAGAARIPELHLDAPLLDALRAAREEGQGMGRAPTAPHQPTLLTLRCERVARRRGRKATRSERSRAGEGRGGGGAAEQACCPSLTAPACPVEIRPEMKGRSGADRRRARREMKGNFCLPIVGDTIFCLPELASVRKAYGQMPILFCNGLLELVEGRPGAVNR